MRLGYIPQTHFSSQRIHFTRAGLEGVAISDVPGGALDKVRARKCLGRCVAGGAQRWAGWAAGGAVGKVGCRKCFGGGLPEMLGRWAPGGAPGKVRWGSA